MESSGTEFLDMIFRMDRRDEGLSENQIDAIMESDF